jgi:hypothetical protein
MGRTIHRVALELEQRERLKTARQLEQRKHRAQARQQPRAQKSFSQLNPLKKLSVLTTGLLLTVKRFIGRVRK